VEGDGGGGGASVSGKHSAGAPASGREGKIDRKGRGMGRFRGGASK